MDVSGLPPSGAPQLVLGWTTAVLQDPSLAQQDGMAGMVLQQVPAGHITSVDDVQGRPNNHGTQQGLPDSGAGGVGDTQHAPQFVYASGQLGTAAAGGAGPTYAIAGPNGIWDAQQVFASHAAFAPTGMAGVPGGALHHHSFVSAPGGVDLHATATAGGGYVLQPTGELRALAPEQAHHHHQLLHPGQQLVYQLGAVPPSAQAGLPSSGEQHFTFSLTAPPDASGRVSQQHQRQQQQPQQQHQQRTPAGTGRTGGGASAPAGAWQQQPMAGGGARGPSEHHQTGSLTKPVLLPPPSAPITTFAEYETQYGRYLKCDAGACAHDVSTPCVSHKCVCCKAGRQVVAYSRQGWCGPCGKREVVSGLKFVRCGRCKAEMLEETYNAHLKQNVTVTDANGNRITARCLGWSCERVDTDQGRRCGKCTNMRPITFYAASDSNCTCNMHTRAPAQAHKNEHAAAAVQQATARTIAAASGGHAVHKLPSMVTAVPRSGGGGSGGGDGGNPSSQGLGMPPIAQAAPSSFPRFSQLTGAIGTAAATCSGDASLTDAAAQAHSLHRVAQAALSGSLASTDALTRVMQACQQVLAYLMQLTKPGSGGGGSAAGGSSGGVGGPGGAAQDSMPAASHHSARPPPMRNALAQDLTTLSAIKNSLEIAAGTISRFSHVLADMQAAGSQLLSSWPPGPGEGCPTASPAAVGDAGGGVGQGISGAHLPPQLQPPASASTAPASRPSSADGHVDVQLMSAPTGASPSSLTLLAPTPGGMTAAHPMAVSPLPHPPKAPASLPATSQPTTASCGTQVLCSTGVTTTRVSDGTGGFVALLPGSNPGPAVYHLAQQHGGNGLVWAATSVMAAEGVALHRQGFWDASSSRPTHVMGLLQAPLPPGNVPGTAPAEEDAGGDGTPTDGAAGAPSAVGNPAAAWPTAPKSSQTDSTSTSTTPRQSSGAMLPGPQPGGSHAGPPAVKRMRLGELFVGGGSGGTGGGMIMAMLAQASAPAAAPAGGPSQ